MGIRTTATGTRTRIRRRVPHLLGAVIAVPVLLIAGCSSSNSSGGAGSGGGSGSASSITVWHYFSDPNQVKVMTDEAALFTKTHPGVKVNNVYVPYDQIDSKLIASRGAKTGPDVVLFNGPDTSNLALAGVLAPIDSQWNSFADKDQFPASVVHKENGKIYSVQGYVNLLGLWYNADLLSKVGVTPPTNMDELTADMAKVKTAGDTGMTLSGLPQSQGEWQAFPWLSAAGFNYANPTEASLEAGLSKVKSWVDSGYVPKEAATWDQTVPFQKFAAGNVAFAENGNWQIATAKSSANFKYGVVPMPVGPNGKVYLGGEAEAIGAFSKAPALAWQYLTQTFLSSAGELAALEDSGTIPARLDTAKNPKVTGNPLLKPFATTISTMGTDYPAPSIPGAAVDKVQLAVGQAWSSVISGQQSPKDAANSVMTALQSLLQK